jgi:hypothetical protein
MTMDDNAAYIRYLEALYAGQDPTLSGNLPGDAPAESDAFGVDETRFFAPEEPHDAPMSYHHDDSAGAFQRPPASSGHVFAAIDRRAPNQRARIPFRRDIDPKSAYWNLEEDSPRLINVTWGNRTYSVPILPPDDADPAWKQIALQNTVSRITNETTPGTPAEKFDLFYNRFRLGTKLLPQVTNRTIAYKDPISEIYVYSDPQVLDAMFAQVFPATPLAANDRATAKYVMTNVRTAPRNVLIAVKTMPEPCHLMNLIIKLPTMLGQVHAAITEVHLHDPRNLISTIKGIPEDEGGGLLLMGVRDGHAINAEKYNIWVENM